MLSIVLPVYNVENYLEECLESLIKQTENKVNFEIIAIDDGSTDNSYNILKSFRKYLPNMKIYTQENSGLSFTRNKGIKLSKGDYIYFLDSDDLINYDTVKIINTITGKNKLDMLIFGGKSFIDGNKNSKIKYDEFKKKGNYSLLMNGKESFIKLLASGDYTSSVCLYAIRREFLIRNKLSFPYGILHEDEIFTFLSILKSDKVNVISDELFYRRIRENSIMTSINYELKLEGIFYNLLEMLKYRDSLDLKSSSKLLNYINIKISYIYGGAINTYLKIDDKKPYNDLINEIKKIGKENNFFDRIEYKLFDRSEKIYSHLRSLYDILKNIRK